MALRSLLRGANPLLPLLSGAPNAGQLRSVALGTAAALSPSSPYVNWYSSSAAISREIPTYGGETLQQIRTRVFGEHAGNGLSSGRKLLRKKLMGEKIAGYYGIQTLEKSDPLFEDLHAAGKKAKLEKLARRGKAPPKKGQGKRGKRK